MLRFTAEVNRAAGGATVRVLETGTASTASAHTAAARINTSSLGTFQLAWSGVDVLDVHFSTPQGRILATSASELGRWLTTSQAVGVTGADNTMLQAWSNQADSLNTQMPLLNSRREIFVPGGSYAVAEANPSWSSSGHAMMHYKINRVSFKAQWANPLWDRVAFHTMAEASQITERIRKAFGAFNDSVIPELQVHLPPDNLWRRAWLRLRWCYSIFQALLTELCALRGGGSFLAGTWLCWHYGALVRRWAYTNSLALWQQGQQAQFAYLLPIVKRMTDVCSELRHLVRSCKGLGRRQFCCCCKRRGIPGAGVSIEGFEVVAPSFIPTS